MKKAAARVAHQTGSPCHAPHHPRGPPAYLLSPFGTYPPPLGRPLGLSASSLASSYPVWASRSLPARLPASPLPGKGHSSPAPQQCVSGNADPLWGVEWGRLHGQWWPCVSGAVLLHRAQDTLRRQTGVWFFCCQVLSRGLGVRPHCLFSHGPCVLQAALRHHLHG